ncbi:Threonine dehydratase, catabolic [Caballeronia sordidicola]|uniref:Threonine dehydratase, catabolic n=1 Tax=Caballeronia sordidicola TaxID=196367 RepID=A0A242MS11_CABSO|nr:Threonine dehydratase, catabolic [Caballeronia sordidicola]
MALDAATRARGVIAYSTGNHGQAIAWAARQLGIAATIVMPSDAPRNKVTRASAHGARVVQYDRKHESREEIGMRLLIETNGTLIPPGDHPDVLAAQGTVALEALEDLPTDALRNLGSFAAPCGGGGLIAGCGLVLDAMSRPTKMISAEPQAFDDTVRSLRSGKRERNSPGAESICDALQAVTPAELPFALNEHRIDQAVAVSDEQVGAAMRFALEELRVLVEPGGAVALASLLAGCFQLDGRDAIIVLSGGNVDLPLLRRLLEDNTLPVSLIK